VLSALDVVNRALERESWARARLAGHAGRSVCIVIGPAKRAFAIDADGRLHESTAGADLQLTVPPLQLPALFAQPERWNELVVVEGDAPLGATLRELALTLPWLVEEICVRAFGAIGGQTIAELGRRLLAFPGYAMERFSDSLVSYVGDEAQLAATSTETQNFGGEIAALTARVDALAQRIEVLDRMAQRGGPGSRSRATGRTRRNSS
jgi:ubiquinone biosynthesis protein UbiJ